MMAKAYLSKGHKSKEIAYLVMNKIASNDALIRMNAAGLDIAVNTIHARAFKELDVQLWNGVKLLSDEGLDTEISKLCKDDVEKFTKGLKYGKTKTRRLICYYIRRTLCNFLRSSHNQKDGLDPKTFGACYYRAVLYHQHGPLPKEKAEVPGFYLCQAKKVWLRLLSHSGTLEPNFYTFESLIKLAQLKKTRIPCTALMVDESQDLTACQHEWLYTQASDYHCDTSFVGDPAQCLYRFLGAKVVLTNLPSSTPFSISLPLSPLTSLNPPPSPHPSARVDSEHARAMPGPHSRRSSPHCLLPLRLCHGLSG